MYTIKNYLTKKALITDLKAGVEIMVYAPGLGSVPNDGPVSLEGPHYPKAHTWYASGVMKNGALASVRA